MKTFTVTAKVSKILTMEIPGMTTDEAVSTAAAMPLSNRKWNELSHEAEYVAHERLGRNNSPRKTK